MLERFKWRDSDTLGGNWDRWLTRETSRMRDKAAFCQASKVMAGCFGVDGLEGWQSNKRRL